MDEDVIRDFSFNPLFGGSYNSNGSLIIVKEGYYIVSILCLVEVTTQMKVIFYQIGTLIMFQSFVWWKLQLK